MPTPDDSFRDRLTAPLSPIVPPLVVAEVAQSHEGSLGLAHAFVDAAADAGADAVKFQTHIAAAEGTPDEPWRVPVGHPSASPQDASRHAYWRRMEFSEEQWAGLAGHARERGLAFLSTPFSPQAFELLERVGVAAWKVASGEVSNTPLLEAMAGTGTPVILSSGMSSWEELDRAVEAIEAASGARPAAILQCTSAYPCPAERLGLGLIPEIAERYGCPSGLSDHSGTPWPGVAAAALGARVVEVHLTLSRQMFGPDVPASLTPEELSGLVAGCRMVATSLAHPVDKDAEAARLEPLRHLFTKSVVAVRHLPAGHVLTGDDLALKKPGTGLPPARLEGLLGRPLARAVARDQRLSDDDLADEDRETR